MQGVNTENAMNDSPLISVIVPVYNVKNYLRQCIESIMAQTYGDIEVILVDDGSTDGSGEICDEYAEKDVRLRVIHKTNGGVGTARNAALSIIRGGMWCLSMPMTTSYRSIWLRSTRQ